jgi:hypothetical protein
MGRPLEDPFGVNTGHLLKVPIRLNPDAAGMGAEYPDEEETLMGMDP